MRKGVSENKKGRLFISPTDLILLLKIPTEGCPTAKMFVSQCSGLRVVHNK
jgi:hypothetical protein